MDDKQLKDEQELAKVLAGLNQEQTNKDNFNSAKPLASLPHVPAKPAEAKPAPAAAPTTTPVAQPLPQPVATPAPAAPVMPTPTPQPAQSAPTPAAAPAKPAEPNEAAKNGGLNDLLHNAISDLRPLVDKLDLPNEEKFDAYLLLIRSTDDSSLVQPAYEIAKKITSETVRAKALLNIIKEINYFNSKK